MSLKRFDDYLLGFSRDPKLFEKRVGLSGSEQDVCDLFEKWSEDSSSNREIPMIQWNTTVSKINENQAVLNRNVLPSQADILIDLNGSQFVPKTITERSAVKSMKFPILAISEVDQEVFNTYGKFKKSETRFKKFREIVKPESKLNMILHKSEPIHLQEEVNGVRFDSDLSRFKFRSQLDQIGTLVNDRYGMDFCNVDLLENSGNLYIDSIDTSKRLEATQIVKMYETAYSSFYEESLPNWFRKSVFERVTVPYYAKKYYDAALLKPKYAKDLSKYAKSE